MSTMENNLDFVVVLEILEFKPFARKERELQMEILWVFLIQYMLRVILSIKS